MEWTTYALVACGSIATICLVMGGIEHFVWKKWDRSQRAAHLAWLEEEVRRLRQECKVAYAEGYDVGHADGFTEGYIDGYARGRDGEHKYGNKRDSDDCPPFGMDRFPTDLI